MKLVEKFKDYLAYRKQAQELHAMSDRDLQDIGIKRGDIDTLVRQSK